MPALLTSVTVQGPLLTWTRALSLILSGWAILGLLIAGVVGGYRWLSVFGGVCLIAWSVIVVYCARSLKPAFCNH